MFRKLISNLTFSPALITEVGFYARRLRQEEITRRLSVFFIVLALIIQSLAIFSAPESANASSEQDMIRGGVRDLEDFITRYDHNEDDIKDIYTAIGVTRPEIVAATSDTVVAHDNIYMLSRYGQLANSESERSLSYPRSSGGIGIRYASPIATISGDTPSFDGWIGQSEKIGWFAILKANGSIATEGPPATLGASTVTLFAQKSLTVNNLSQKTSVNAQPLNKISYTLKASNPGTESLTVPLEIRIADILEYANLIDAGGGSYDQRTATLSWPQVELPPGQTQERTFAIQLLATLPATPAGSSNPASYNCSLDVTFGNTANTPIDCPGAKTIEGIFAVLPKTGNTANIIFATIVLTIITFFYLRTRQLRSEIRIIRHNFNNGTL
jgi:hypothetical protein